jgi:hypothetical protein
MGACRSWVVVVIVSFFSSYDLAMVPEAPLQETEHGRMPLGRAGSS